MIKRELEPIILQMAQKMPIVSISGPRQAGKTTLAKMCFPHYRYVNLESPETRLAAVEDPKGFLRNNGHGLIIDEAQRVPELFSYLQAISDETGRPGEYILTGSQNFLFMRTISQSLAGRVFLTHLLPFSLHELDSAGRRPSGANNLMVQGFYPRLYDKQIEPGFFYPSYSQTYLERDIASLVHAGNLIRFRKFMELLAGRTGQLINFSALGVEVGVDYKTIQSWCSMLEASFIIFFLRPFHRNFSKRIIKSSKIYFYDTGLACHLLGITTAADVERHWARGALFENLVIADYMKDFFNRGVRPPLYFWRDNKGVEVDLLMEEAGTLKAIEIKSGTTVTGDYFTNIGKFSEMSGGDVTGYVVYGGDETSRRSNGMVLPWFEKDRVFVN
jgi:predicted AAA+ superfamily ATPase